jgi:hypothetical protein
MKKGKIILGAATFLVTAAGVLAFKVHSRHFRGKLLYCLTAPDSSNCTLSTCHTLAGGPLDKSACHTADGNLCYTLGVTGNGTIYTTVTTTNHKKCLHPITKWNHLL